MAIIKLNASVYWNDNRTVWYLVSLVTQGLIFLPIPAILMSYYNAPIILMAITMTLFFANVIAGLGGLSIRTMISWFALSILVHILMLAIFIG